MAAIQEKHGLADALEQHTTKSEFQSVVVTDGDDDLVHLSIGGQTYPAGLAPVQARYIAACLIASAERVEASTEGRAP